MKGTVNPRAGLGGISKQNNWTGGAKSFQRKFNVGVLRAYMLFGKIGRTRREYKFMAHMRLVG
ncbi:hypothetical protein [Paenibacillus cremeus]|uniref:Uncharacterized protein n=1 Tax=Paenibacillus cremeus TaxID=2163881 RepID=A0A559KIN6_9BACL|nr:hypothetical protein [Paenibacillus cremeus]TVY11928.1 hypothetical protein FPZ49_01180 [Paenibacillus cremeus]